MYLLPYHITFSVRRFFFLELCAPCCLLLSLCCLASCPSFLLAAEKWVTTAVASWLAGWNQKLLFLRHLYLQNWISPSSAIFAATSSSASYVVLMAAALFIWSFCRPVVVLFCSIFLPFFLVSYVLGIVVGRPALSPEAFNHDLRVGPVRQKDRHPGPTRGKYKWNFKMWSDLIMHGKSKEDSHQGQDVIYIYMAKKRYKRQPLGFGTGGAKGPFVIQCLSWDKE